MKWSSVTADGRKGTIALINRLLPDVPVQFCIFHQKAIVRRYLTAKPKTLCGKELRVLISFLGHISEKIFMACLEDLGSQYADFLKERNAQKQFMHRRLRSALRSLRSNAPYLFAYQRFPDQDIPTTTNSCDIGAATVNVKQLIDQDIPTTTNSCDGSFAHWKNKVKIHRGLKKERRAKIIPFLLSKT